LESFPQPDIRADAATKKIITTSLSFAIKNTSICFFHFFYKTSGVIGKKRAVLKQQFF
jgi:hypothetical protein